MAESFESGRQSSRSEQADLLHQEYNDRYQGRGALIQNLIDLVHTNPDISPDELYHHFESQPEYPHLNQEQKDSFNQALETYLDRHQTVKSYLERYPNPADLFAACFGLQPVGRVEVVTGAMTMHFICHDERDFSTIYVTNDARESAADHRHSFFGVESIHQMFAAAALKKLEGVVGTALPELKDSDLDGIITAAKVDETINPQDTLVHEEQHQLNDLFRPKVADWTYPETITVDSNEELQKVTQRTIYRVARAFRIDGLTDIDQQAHQEILAFYREGRSLKEIQHHLSTHYLRKFKLENAKDIERMPAVIQRLIEENITVDMNGQVAPMEVNPNQAELLTWRTLNDEFLKDLNSWLRAIRKLENKGYDPEAIVTLLMQENLSQWRKIARRMDPVR